MTAYYNEIDPFAAAWLRELIKEGLIAQGEVDERSIEDVLPSELMGFTQCHFFAGIGGWSLALRLAGWPDDRPVWTGSCPCQPFSSAGKGKGFADERHLWPAFHWHISQCRPRVVFGEQVASKDGLTWLDLVSSDLEASGYACGPVVFPSCGVGAPHIRSRLYWVAESESERKHDHAGVVDDSKGKSHRETRNEGGDGDATGFGLPDGGMAESIGCGFSGESRSSRAEEQRASECRLSCRPGATNGFWGAADWLYCRDGFWRPVEPSTFPLAHGVPNRVGRLRGYGNAINVEAAKSIIEAYLNK